MLFGSSSARQGDRIPVSVLFSEGWCSLYRFSVTAWLFFNIRSAFLYPPGLGIMDDGQSILEAINEECSDDFEDVEMVDVEEGELVDRQTVHNECPNTSGIVYDEKTAPSLSRSKKRRKNKNKKKKKKAVPHDVTDINRFVIDVCRRLKEKKSYLVYTAVGCLGLSAFSDLVKEVDAIQACGGQKTVEGNRFRTGGGILWNILKTREPNAYREIMKKGKEFEKQFRLPIGGRIQPANNKITPQNELPSAVSNHLTAEIVPDETITLMQNPDKQEVEQRLEKDDDAGRKRVSVCERIRVPVSYDDELFGDEPK